MNTEIHKSDRYVLMETVTKTRTAQTVGDRPLKNYSGSLEEGQHEPCNW